MTIVKSGKVLISIDQIRDYLGGKSAEVVKNLIQLGMPARNIKGTWYAHADNIDDWFKLYTRVRNNPAAVPD